MSQSAVPSISGYIGASRVTKIQDVGHLGLGAFSGKCYGVLRVPWIILLMDVLFLTFRFCRA